MKHMLIFAGLLLLLANNAALGAEEANPGIAAGADPSPPVVRLLETNSAVSVVKTNPQPSSLTESNSGSPGSTDGHSAILPALDTNSGLPAAAAASNSTALPASNPSSINPTVGDTNSPGFSIGQTRATILRNPPPTPRFDLQSFRLVWERNIFNPNRRPARFGGGPRRPEERRNPSQSFALIGTLSYEKGRFAFFDGSSFEYRQVLKPADTIAGYKIAEIAPNYVKLEGTNGQAIELAVGKEMKKWEEAEWRLGERSSSSDSPRLPAAASTSGEAGDSTERTESSSAPQKAETSSASADEVLKKLLEKREQELNK